MVWRLRIKDRVMEWHLAVYTLLFGLWLSGPDDALNPTLLQQVLTLWAEDLWARAFTIIGAAHLVSLAINGAAWWTPYARAVAASLNLFAYAFLAAGFWIDAPHSAGFPTYAFLVVPELVTVLFRALRDCFLIRRSGGRVV